MMGTRRSAWVVAAAVFAGVFGGRAWAEAIETKGRVGEVTVYRDQALVTRVMRVQLPAGASEVVVRELPERLVGESLFATGGEGVEVRALRYRERAVEEEPREEVRRLQEEIKATAGAIERNGAMQELAREGVSYLGKLEGFVAPTAQVELSKGVLDAETLKALTVFMLAQRAEHAEKTLALTQEGRELGERMGLLKKQLAEVSAGSSRTVREAVLFLDAERAGEAEVKVTYVVRNAGWEPLYNVRANKGGKAIEVEYNAAIYQMSGEDWEDTELALSTASPTLVADGPALAPLWVRLLSREAQQAAQRSQEEVGKAYRQLKMKVQAQAQAQQQAVTTRENTVLNWDTNVSANAAQVLEMMLDRKALKEGREEREGETRGLSVTYRLPGRIGIASRSDKQMVTIAKAELASDFYYVATPVLTEFVYREAEALNDSDLAILEGPATVYLDGGFVGKSTVPMVARGQRFRIGLGLEAELRAMREVIDRSEQTMGANREIGIRCRVTLENTGKEAAVVRVYERLPYASGEGDIRVSLGEMTEALSEDRLYLERERSKGILRWDVELAGGAAGAEARKVEYGYKMELDRTMEVETAIALSDGQQQAGAPGSYESEFRNILQDRKRAR